MQSPDAAATAQSFFEALNASRWESAAALVDEQFSSRLRQELIAIVSNYSSEVTAANERTGGFAVPPSSTAAHLQEDSGGSAAVLALPGPQFDQWCIKATQQTLGGVDAQARSVVHRRLLDVQQNDDSNATVGYQLETDGQGSGVTHPKQALTLRRYHRQWFVVPSPEIVSPAILARSLLSRIR